MDQMRSAPACCVLARCSSRAGAEMAGNCSSSAERPNGCCPRESALPPAASKSRRLAHSSRFCNFPDPQTTARQYALADRACQLGWSREQVIVIDEDLGLSGSSVDKRSGFTRLTNEVALAHVGIVLGLEVSRLARKLCCVAQLSH
jgi:hypothetical protein